MAHVSYSNESPGAVHLDMITHMLNQRGGAHKAIDRQEIYHEGALDLLFLPSDDLAHARMVDTAQHQVEESATHMLELRRRTEQQLDAFMLDPKLTSLGFPPMDKVYRYIMYRFLFCFRSVWRLKNDSSSVLLFRRHEAANDKCLVSYSIGAEDKDRHTIVWKPHAAPSQEELERMQATKEVRPDAQTGSVQ